MELKAVHNQNIIHSVQEGSIAEELGILPGDQILSINDIPIEDIIEYSYLEADEYIELEIRHQDGEVVIYEIEKDFDEQIGLEFSNPIIESVKSCNNKCIFCFIDQLPEGMRETLYIKDDDSRLSFLQGNFITMTNMKDKDIDKMIEYRISPVNISVHTTNPKLRVEMLKNKFAGNILKNIQRLAEANITMNAQIVCIPNINDKEELQRTIDDLAKFYPQMQSVAVVPVGLTKYRENLPALTLFGQDSSQELIEQIESMQQEFLKKIGTRFVFASDEFYVMANREVLQEEEYENYIQLENGVGLMRKFQTEVENKLRSIQSPIDLQHQKITIATGYSAYEFMKKIAHTIQTKLPSLEIEVVRIDNDFFGRTITVAGLITGQDLVAQLSGRSLGDALFLPRVMFRADELVFLDDYLPQDVEKALDTPIVICEIDGEDLVNRIINFRREHETNCSDCG